ncbi:glyoxalase-like domain protein [Anaerotignum neopropionicum]|uniref:Glyoxalase-like domain protein n=1 Tax=Anaerotignum neopropionicum TaxID=36847 RepID=A0A136WFN5_9FIRM|nr:VOC family protein [Anaerotignum neopropionicum]KXL53315.1 glyoxalase-like domain protein [Anaerotignum neopropionicum]
MKFKNPLLVVSDLEKSKQFYKEVLGLRVVMDFGANVTLTGGVSLQTQETWLEFIHAQTEELYFDNKTTELYFEEENFDIFIQKLKTLPNIDFVHHVFEHRWGQRVVRLYDPDKHIIEVGEKLKSVCLRFLKNGLSKNEIAVRMDVPLMLVEKLLK